MLPNPQASRRLPAKGPQTQRELSLKTFGERDRNREIHASGERTHSAEEDARTDQVQAVSDGAVQHREKPIANALRQDQ